MYRRSWENLFYELNTQLQIELNNTINTITTSVNNVTNTTNDAEIKVKLNIIMAVVGFTFLIILLLTVFTVIFERKEIKVIFSKKVNVTNQSQQISDE